MQSRGRLLCPCWGVYTILLGTPISGACAAIVPLALTGESAGGVSGAEFASVLVGPINDSGEATFIASLAQDVGGVTSQDDEGVWRATTSGTSLLARKGIGAAPEVPGSLFDSLIGTSAKVAIDDSGSVALRAQLQVNVGGVTTSNHKGIWQLTESGNSLVARSGSGGVPGNPTANYLDLPVNLRYADSGRLAWTATILNGGGMTPKGLWSKLGPTGTQVALEDVVSVPGIPAATFVSFAPPSVNDSNHVTAFSQVEGGGVTNSNDLGVWRFDGTSGTMRHW